MAKDLSSNEQSYFSTDQEQIQPPPEYQTGTLQGDAYRQKRHQRNRIFMIVSAIFGLIIILVVLVAVLGQNPPPGEAEPTPTPLPTSAPSALENEMRRLENIVSAANPDENLLPPPSVDMNIDF